MDAAGNESGDVHVLGELVLDGHALDIEAVVRVARDLRRRVSVAEEARQRVRAGRRRRSEQRDGGPDAGRRDGRRVERLAWRARRERRIPVSV